jgi:hypothetical protein
MALVTPLARSLGLVVCLICAAAASGIARTPQVHAVDADFDFGRVLKGTAVEHEFVVRNERPSPMAIDAVRLTAPLTLVKAPSTVPPGAQGIVRVRLDTSRVAGLFEGRIVIAIADSDDEIGLTFTGTVYQTVEVLPQPLLFVITDRGRVEERSIELVNHEAAAVDITGVTHPHDRFTTRVETLEPGRRFRLTVRLDGKGPGGRRADAIVVATSSQATPVVRILANTFVRERVYTFPDAVDFGAVPLGALDANPALLERVAQTLMVYRNEPGFEVTVTTDLDLLDVHAERGPRGDRWQTTVRLKRERLHPGPFRGTIVIETNDPEFSRLSVPVTGFLRP